MSRRERQRQAKRLFGEDVEVHQIALPEMEVAGYRTIREYFESHKWWMLIGFQSEDRVEKIFGELEGRVENCEKFIWPVVRMGALTGTSQDVLILLFVDKQGITFAELEKIFSKHGSRGSKAANLTPGERDFFVISFGYMVTLANVFAHLVSYTSFTDN